MKKVWLNVVRKTSPNYMKYYALVDDEDFDKVSQYNWTIDQRNNTNYATGYVNGKNVLLHRFVSGFEYVDHKNGNGLDNRKSNLRSCSHNQNMQNRISKRGISKYKGVSWHKGNGKWVSTISIGGKKKILGYCDNEKPAALLYDKAAKEHYGDYAKINFI